MNTAIFSPSGGSVGLGFAIPASTVDSVVDALEHGGVVTRGYLGVMIQPVSQDIADGLGLKAAGGALVDKAEPGTPAAEAGLKSGDVITKLNGQPVKDAADLTRQVAALKPGDKVEMSFLRDGAEKTVSLTLASQKNEQTAMADAAQNESALPSWASSWRRPSRSRAPAMKAWPSSTSIPTAWRRAKASRPATSFSMSPARRCPSPTKSRPKSRRPSTTERKRC